MPLPLVAWIVGGLLLGAAGVAMVLVFAAWIEDRHKEEIESFLLNRDLKTIRSIFVRFTQIGNKILHWFGVKSKDTEQVMYTSVRRVKNPQDMPDELRAKHEALKARKMKRASVDVTSTLIQER